MSSITQLRNELDQIFGTRGASHEWMKDRIMGALTAHIQAVGEEIIYVDGRKKYEAGKKSDLTSVVSAAAMNSLVERQMERLNQYLGKGNR